MMTWLCFFLFINQPATRLQVDGPFLKPTVFWEDLNQDGHLDIWIRDITEKIWVKDGANQATPFKLLPFQRLSGRERPLWHNGQWTVTTFFKDSYLHYLPEAGWQVHLDYNNMGEFRQGLPPQGQGMIKLVPSINGYWLAEGDCIRQRFQVLPAISLKNNRLKVTYPIPQWRDIDQDGYLDLFGPPVSFQHQGYLGLWTALKRESNWEQSRTKLQMSPELEIQQFEIGDVNGDNIQDLVIIAQPSKDLSIFEELSFIVYIAEAHGLWNPIPLQTLKTRQNLWQTGPIEVNRDGIFIYYYKGLIRSKFKIDRYVWDPAGFIDPKPVSAKWKIKEADRNFIVTDYDFNGDQLKDLLLKGEDGLQIHFRQPTSGRNLPFSEHRKANFSEENFLLGNASVSIQFGGNGSANLLVQGRLRNSLRHEKRSALIVHQGDYSFWYFKIDDHGNMSLYGEPATIK